MQSLNKAARLSARKSSSIPLNFTDARPFSTAVAATAIPKVAGPGLDINGEPRFLEQVKLFFKSASSKTGIDPEYLNLIQAC